MCPFLLLKHLKILQCLVISELLDHDTIHDYLVSCQVIT